MNFEVLKVEDVDGRIYMEWESVADDGLPLIEGDFFAIDATEAAIVAVLADVKARRHRFNSQPKTPPRQPPKAKRAVDAGTLERIKERTEE